MSESPIIILLIWSPHHNEQQPPSGGRPNYYFTLLIQSYDKQWHFNSLKGYKNVHSY